MTTDVMSPADRSRQVGQRVSVSSFCFHRELGDTRFDIETPTGEAGVYVIPGHNPPQVSMADLPGLVRQRLGVDAMELCQVQLSSETLDAVAAALADGEVSVTAIPIDLGNLATPHEERRQTYLADTRRWLDLAARLGAPFARVNAGSPAAGAAHSQAALVSSLIELADYATAHDVSLLVENHGGISADPDWLLALLCEVGTDRLGLILDTGNLEPMVTAAHARFSGQPLNESGMDFTPMYAAVARLAPAAAIVHAKAYDIDENGRFGPVDLQRLLEIVRDHGFDGPVTVEYEGSGSDVWGRTQQTVGLVRSVFDR